MKKILLSAVLTISLIGQTASAATGTSPAFSDVNENTTYVSSISWMADNNVIEGYPDGTFKPDQCVNRAEFLKMLFLTDENVWHMADYSYPDVDPNEWYASYVSYYSARSVVQGYPDGMFRPGQCVNRVEAIKMADLEFAIPWGGAYAGLSLKVDSYKDIDHSAWYFDYFEHAISENILGLEHVVKQYNELNPYYETDQYFGPGGDMTRKEVAEMLYRMKTVKDNNLSKYQDTYSPNSLSTVPEGVEIAFDSCKVPSTYSQESWWTDFVSTWDTYALTLDGTFPQHEALTDDFGDYCLALDKSMFIFIPNYFEGAGTKIFKYDIIKNVVEMADADGVHDSEEFGLRESNFIPVYGIHDYYGCKYQVGNYYYLENRLESVGDTCIN